MINVLVHGSNGKMGKHVRESLEKSSDKRLMCGVDSLANGSENYPCYKSFDEVKTVPDIIIDFSFHRLIGGLLDFAIKNNCPVIIATTGFDLAEEQLIKDAAKSIPIFWSYNMSVGIALLIDCAKKVALSFPDSDIEIVEAHHNRKIDAPSGTAIMIAEGLMEIRKDANLVFGRSGECKRDKSDIGINSLRMANIVGEHEVFVTTESQQIAIKHTAFDRSLFADGAVDVVPFMLNKRAGIYNMNDYLGEK